MFMNYRYPALVRGQIGSSRNVRPLMVAMHGRAEVEELDFSDAPVAATIGMLGRKAVFRYHRGKLYMEAGEGGAHEFRSGLDTHMALKIADACHLPAGRDIQPWPKEATDCLKNVVLARDNFRTLRGEFTKISEYEWNAMVSISALRSYEQADVEKWEAVAAGYVGDLIFLDGDLWMPVAEPVFAVIERATPFVTLIDASVYQSRHDNPKDQPAPFGRRVGFTPPFWEPGTRLYSLLEADDLLDHEFLPWLGKPEIFLPSAFEENHVGRELDRVARIVVAELYSFYGGQFGSVKATPASLRNQWNAMRQALSMDDGDVARGERLAHQLQLTKAILGGMKSENPQLLGADGMIGLITDIGDRWANREISLDVSWSQPKTPAP